MDIVYSIVRFFEGGSAFMSPILLVAAVGAAIARALGHARGSASEPSA
jgi:hypothetical protein